MMNWPACFWPLASASLLLLVLPLEGSAALRNLALLLCCSAFGLNLWRQWSLTGERPRFQLPLWPLWGLYAGIAAIGLAWAVDPAYSGKEIRLEILFAALYFWLGANLLRRADDLRWLLASLCSGNLLLVGYTLNVWLAGGATKDGLIGTYHTGVGNFSTYLVTILPFLAWALRQAWIQRQGWRWPLLLLLAANFFAIYITANRQAIVAVAAELLVVLAWLAPRLRQPRQWLPVLLVLAVLAGVFQQQMSKRLGNEAGSGIVAALERDGRLPIWKFAIGEALAHPWHGGGMGRESLIRQYPEHPLTQGVFVHAHNMLVNRLVQLGVPGLLAFVALFAALAWALWRHRRVAPLARQVAVVGLAVCAGVWVKNMTDDFFVREQAYLFWFLAGALLALQRQALATTTPQS
ncbi:O-antigen ligase family protein [Dechloromonas sp. ZY10]|uniref:O-antigen ligase family protein n=1 Tax=Dechloromonas aquae TaxID=2664436 RepID=UPI0035290D07